MNKTTTVPAGYRCSRRRIGLKNVAVFLCLWLAAVAVDAKDPVAIFHVGNSLTDQAYGMHDIAKARGHETKFGRHMIPGAPLEWLWNHRAEGFREPGRDKPADEILKGSKWDVLILQPFGRPADNAIQYGANYAAAAYEGNPACQVYVFANYPEIGKDREKADQWEQRWLSDNGHPRPRPLRESRRRASRPSSPTRNPCGSFPWARPCIDCTCG